MDAKPIGSYRCISKNHGRLGKFVVSLRNTARNEQGSMVLEMPPEIAEMFAVGEEFVFGVQKVHVEINR